MACSSCSQRYINAATRRATPRNVAARVSLAQNRSSRSVRGIIKNTPDVQPDTPSGVTVANPAANEATDPSTGLPVSLIVQGTVSQNNLKEVGESSSDSSNDTDLDD